MKGIIVRVYKTQDGGNRSLIPSQHLDNVLLIGEGVPERVATQQEKGPVFLSAFRLVRKIIFGCEHVHVEPVERPPGGTYAFGGNYVFIDDEGFSLPYLGPYLVPIHDQWIPINYPYPD